MATASEFPFLDDPLYQAVVQAENAYYAVQTPLRHDRFVKFLEALGTFINQGQHHPKMSEIAREFQRRNQGAERHTRFIAATFQVPAGASTKLLFRGQEMPYQLWACLGNQAQVYDHARARGYNLADPVDVARNEARLDQTGILTMDLSNGQDEARELEKLRQAAPTGTSFQF